MKGWSQVLLLGVLSVVSLVGCAQHRFHVPSDPISQANALEQQGRFREAVAQFQQAAYCQPNDAEAHERYAEALMHANDQMFVDKVHHLDYRDLRQPSALDVPVAIAEYRRAVQLKPSEPLFHLALAQALSSQGKTSEAIAEYHTTIRLLPKTAMVLIQAPNVYRDNAQVLMGAYEGLADALVAAKQYPEAIKQYSQAVKWEPGHGYDYVRLALADALNKNGQRAEARTEWQTVAAAHDSWSKTAQQKLRQYPPPAPR